MRENNVVLNVQGFVVTEILLWNPVNQLYPSVHPPADLFMHNSVTESDLQIFIKFIVNSMFEATQSLYSLIPCLQPCQDCISAKFITGTTLFPFSVVSSSLIMISVCKICKFYYNCFLGKGKLTMVTAQDILS